MLMPQYARRATAAFAAAAAGLRERRWPRLPRMPTARTSPPSSSLQGHVRNPVPLRHPRRHRGQRGIGPRLRRHRRRLGRQRPRRQPGLPEPGLYDYQPIYITPTTLSDTVVRYNLVHGTKKVFHDGGSIYNLSANPGAVIDDNYIYDNRNTVGLYRRGRLQRFLDRL